MSEINRMTENDKRLSGAAMDEYALMIARRLAAVDRHRLAGADTQFVAILQCALIEAMREGVKQADAARVREQQERACAAMLENVVRGDFRKSVGSSTADLRESGLSSTDWQAALAAPLGDRDAQGKA